MLGRLHERAEEEIVDAYAGSRKEGRKEHRNFVGGYALV